MPGFGLFTYIGGTDAAGLDLIIEVTDNDGNFREYVRADGEISSAVAKFLKENESVLDGAGMTFGFDKNGNINAVKAIKLGTASGNLTIDAITGLNGVVIEGTKLTGNLTVKANNVTVKNLEVTGTVTVETGVTEFTAEGTNFDTLTLNGGGTDSVHLNDAEVKTINVAAKVRVVLDDTKVTSNVNVTVAGAKVEVEGDSEVKKVTAGAAVEITGAAKVKEVEANAKGVVLDEEPEKISGSEGVKIGDEEKSKEDLLVAAAEEALAAYEAAVEELEDTVDGTEGKWLDAEKAAVKAQYAAYAAVKAAEPKAFNGEELVTELKDFPLAKELKGLDDKLAKIKAVRVVNDADKNAMKTALEAVALGLDLDDYHDLTEGGRQDAVVSYVDFVKTVDGDYKTVEDIKEAFDRAVKVETYKMYLINLAKKEDVDESLEDIIEVLKAEAEKDLVMFTESELNDYYGEYNGKSHTENLNDFIGIMEAYLDLENKGEIEFAYGDGDTRGSYVDAIERLGKLLKGGASE